MGLARNIMTNIIENGLDYETGIRLLIEADATDPATAAATPPAPAPEKKTKKSEDDEKKRPKKDSVSFLDPFRVAKREVVSQWSDKAKEHPYATLALGGAGAWAAARALMHATGGNNNGGYQHMDVGQHAMHYGHPPMIHPHGHY